MVDIVITNRRSTQHRYGVQSILFVNKQIREEGLKIFFQKCTFEIPHFKLHEKHIRENPTTGLDQISKLDILWTPPPARRFTTTKGDDRLLLGLPKLQQMTINLLNRQYIRLRANLTRAEFQKELETKVEKMIPCLPRWIRRALHVTPRDPRLKLFLIVYVAVGNWSATLDADLTVSHSKLHGTSHFTYTFRLLRYHGRKKPL